LPLATSPNKSGARIGKALRVDEIAAASITLPKVNPLSFAPDAISAFDQKCNATFRRARFDRAAT
jgi:hypothetical protein